MQSTWDASADGWDTTSHIWANETYQHSASLSNTLGKASSFTMAMPVAATISQLFLDKVNDEDKITQIGALLGTFTGVTASSILKAVGLSTLSSDHSQSSSSNQKFASSANFDNTLDETASTLVTWQSAADFNHSLDSSNAEDATLSGNNATLSGNYGIITSTTLVLPTDATLGLVTDSVNNTNYPHSGTITGNYGMTSSSAFLWNSINEDTTTWTTVTEDSTTWTKETEDTTTWTKQ